MGIADLTVHIDPFWDKRGSALTSLINSISDNGFGASLFVFGLGHQSRQLSEVDPPGDILCPSIQIVTLDRWAFHLTYRNIRRAGTLP